MTPATALILCAASLAFGYMFGIAGGDRIHNIEITDLETELANQDALLNQLNSENENLAGTIGRLAISVNRLTESKSTSPLKVARCGDAA
jgi:uncharacterized coiled-coil protein SlyX